MSSLLSLLCEAITGKSRDKNVAVLLSGGLDSLSVAIALQKVGKTISAYTLQLDGYASKDIDKAEAIARHFGWPLTVITVPCVDIADDFVRLAVQHRCQRKTQFESVFPFLYVFPAVEESEVWTGWCADPHYGNTKNDVMRYWRMARDGVPAAEMKADFDRERQKYFAELDSSGETWCFAKRYADRLEKRLLDPYLDKAVGDYFLQFDHAELSPLNKPHVRKALAEELAGMPKGSITVGVQMQLGGAVNTLFERLLDDPRINRFERRYGRVSDLCRRWGKEVTRDPEVFERELALIDKTNIIKKLLDQGVSVKEVAAYLRMKVTEVELFVNKIKTAPAPTAPTSVPSTATGPEEPKTDAYHPYSMADVRKASAAGRFSVVSMFAGGGGSSIGYRLAGGEVILVSEFVPEAARTYRANFPDTLVDPRDICDIVGHPDGPASFIAQAGLKPGELDILDGSPPCSEFSVAGSGIHDQTVMRSYSDVQQRGIADLIFKFMTVAARTMPKVVIAENVPTLAGKYVDILDRALDRLRFPEGDRGPRAYYAAHTVLSADNFGVPQKRRRLFIVAVRADVAQAVSITNDDGVKAVFPESTQLGCTVRMALTGLQQTDRDVRPFRMAAMGTQLGHLIRLFPKNPPKAMGLSDVDPDTTAFKLKRAAWDAPSMTLTVTGQKDPDGLSGVVHPTEDRKFSLPELKRLTGLPDDYVATGTLAQACERVCRMVPPPLTKAIAERVYNRVLRPYPESRT